MPPTSQLPAKTDERRNSHTARHDYRIHLLWRKPEGRAKRTKTSDCLAQAELCEGPGPFADDLDQKAESTAVWLGSTKRVGPTKQPSESRHPKHGELTGDEF